MKPETKAKIFRVLNITMWSLLVVGLFVSLGFVEEKQNKLICKNLDITIARDEEIYFVQKDDIRQLLKDRKDSIVNQPVSSINIPQIEKVINSHPSVSTAEVFMDVNGDLKIDITQRIPLIRIINANNESYYIDTTGRLMPLSDNYSAKILVANGTINEPYAKRYMYSIENILNNPNVTEKTVLDDLFALAKYINNDSFWKAQVQQIYVNEDGEFEIIPRVGDHVILLGDASDIDEKFNKLMTFYKEGMNKTGWWNNYSLINLKYKNQVVCTRKEETKEIKMPKASPLKADLPREKKEKEPEIVSDEAPKIKAKTNSKEEKKTSKSNKKKNRKNKKLK